MKKFNELTDAEKVALTHVERQAYIDLLCAENGVALLPAEPAKVTKTEIPKTDSAYSVSLPYDAYFSREVAQEIVDFINSKPAFQSKHVSGWSSPEYLVILPEDATADYRKKAFHTNDEAVKQYNAYHSEKSAIEAYDEAKSAYDKAFKARSEYVEQINDEITGAYNREQFRLTCEQEWERYCELANYNLPIAKNFFVARHNIATFETIVISGLGKDPHLFEVQAEVVEEVIEETADIEAEQ